MQKALKMFQSFGPAGKGKTLNSAVRVCYQVALGLVLPSPYYLVLDNDVLNALQKPSDYEERYVALMLLFDFMKTQTQEFLVAVTPVTLWEFSCHEPFKDQLSLASSLEHISELISHTGLSAKIAVPTSITAAQKLHKSLLHDIRLITNYIVKVKGIIPTLDVQLKTDKGIKFPHVAAAELTPELHTKYFSKKHANDFLAGLVEHLILLNKSTNSYARSNMKSEDVTKLANLLKIKKNKLKGSGDLAILSLCDISRQYFIKDDVSVIGVTFDGTLEHVLRDYSKIVIGSAPITVSECTVDAGLGKLRAFMSEAQALMGASQEGDRFINQFLQYLSNNGCMS